VVEYVGCPDGIVSVLRKLEDAVIGYRKQIYNLRVVPGKVVLVALCLWHWRGPRGYTHSQCLPVRGQQSKEHQSCAVGGRGCTWGKVWFLNVEHRGRCKNAYCMHGGYVWWLQLAARSVVGFHGEFCDGEGVEPQGKLGIEFF